MNTGPRGDMANFPPFVFRYIPRMMRAYPCSSRQFINDYWIRANDKLFYSRYFTAKALTGELTQQEMPEEFPSWLLTSSLGSSIKGSRS